MVKVIDKFWWLVSGWPNRPHETGGNECGLVTAGDFKSLCRARKPSEVGSIPTHSRHLCLP